ncbi:MAG: precorrin-6y C5,15-methyltransferase (decarboxylating) subunit CbiE [Alphaproteobacteria bacterium]
MTAWLTVLGMGDDGLDGLPPARRTLIETAEVLVGGERHLALVDHTSAERLGWQFPLDPLMDELKARRSRRVVILATGDPLCFGIGTTLLKHLDREEMIILPAPSAFALARARLGWPAHTTTELTLHGRPLSLLNGWLQPGRRLLLLSHDGATPAQVAKLLAAQGFGPSRLSVLAHMGGDESRVDAAAADWCAERLPDLNTIAVELVAAPDAVVRPRLPGLPDDAFENDGQLTKREVRAATLAALAPLSGQRLWDVGAGSGSVAIEWLRAVENADAVAIERDPARAATIARNAEALGTPFLEIVTGTAPEALLGQAPPDAVFVGGGLSADGLLDAVWRALRPGGRLVANAVTVEGEQRLLSARSEHGGTLTRLSISRAEPVGGYLGWRPLMPVTQWAATKP